MSKSEKRKAQRNLSLGYALPIIGGAVAFIFGLMVYDLNHTILDIWVWIIIQAILGASFVWGTRTSTMAFNFALQSGKKVGAIKGARNLNMVLGIIWSIVVIIMAFVNLGTAIAKHQQYNFVDLNPAADKMATVHQTGYYISPFRVDDLFHDFLPAFVLLLLVLAGVFLLLTERSTEHFMSMAEMREAWHQFRSEIAEAKAAKVAEAASPKGNDSSATTAVNTDEPTSKE